MDVLVQQGKVLYVGSSNFPGWNIAQANEAAARRGSLGLVSEQCLYNLFERRAEMEVIPAAEAYGVGVIPWSPLQGGLLGGVLRKEREGGGARSTGGRSAEALGDPAQRARIQAYEDLCEKHGAEPGEVALAWLLTRPGVTGPIVGPRTAGPPRLGAAGGRAGPGRGLPGRARRDLPRARSVPGGVRLVSRR